MEKEKNLKVIKDSFEIHDVRYFIEWHDSDDFEGIENDQVRQVYGLCFDKEGKVAIVKYENDSPNLPGGKVEEGEDWQDAFLREIAEEINMNVAEFLPLGYQIPVGETDTGERRKYELRVVARVEPLKKQTSDPAGTVIGYEFVNLDQLNELIEYGLVGERMAERAVKKLGEL